jgi:hypothetical protein
VEQNADNRNLINFEVTQGTGRSPRGTRRCTAQP